MARGNAHPNTSGLKRTAGPGRPAGSKNKLTVARVEEEIRHQALFDPRQLIGKVGRGRQAQFTLREIAELPDAVAACLASYDVVLGNENKSDGRLESVVRVRWYDKQRALELCAKHFGWIDDRATVNVQLDAEIMRRLKGGQADNAQRDL